MLCLDRFWIFHSLTVLIPLYFFFFHWTQLHTVFYFPAVTSAGPPLTHVVCITWRSRHWSLNLVSSLLPSSAHPTIERPLQPQREGIIPIQEEQNRVPLGCTDLTCTLVIRVPLFIHHLGQYSGSVVALHHLLDFMCVLILQWDVQGLFTLSIQLCVIYIRCPFFIIFPGPVDWRGIAVHVWKPN